MICGQGSSEVPPRRLRRVAGAGACVLALVSPACADDAVTDRSVAPRISTPPAEPSSPRPPASPPSFAPQAIDLELEEAAAGLDSPLLVTHADDGSGRLFVVEQDGLIKVVEGGRALEEPFLDVSDLTEGVGEQGLLGLAFHPDYEDNGRFFVNYSDNEGDTVVAEYRRATAVRADEPAVRFLLRIDQPFVNHNGGHLLFGPDGYLYIGMGDGGSAGDPQGNGQDLSTLLGKMLRIDVDTESPDRPYGIPPDNPFVDRAGARPEIWAFGLRNPWRYSFDARGNLWIGDVGQGALEEIDVLPPDGGGANLGWNVMEGSACYEAESCDRSGLHLPITEYGHDAGCSITGGHVYEGRDYPDLAGAYLFTDYCSGTIWAIDGSRLRRQGPIELLASDRSLSSFGVDERGELYVTDIESGEVLLVVDDSP